MQRSKLCNILCRKGIWEQLLEKVLRQPLYLRMFNNLMKLKEYKILEKQDDNASPIYGVYDDAGNSNQCIY